jgi:hypothetical protein
VIRYPVNLCGTKASRKGHPTHPIWWLRLDVVPYIAVNEVEQGGSRRFGRDSFQTRSTC